VAFRTAANDHNVWDAVVVGDSFGFCHHIEMEDCWVTHVADSTELKLANLSVPGTGSVSHSRYLEKYGRKLNPRYVIWQYWVNDSREDVQHVANGFKPCPDPERNPDLRIRETELRQWLEQFSVSVNLI
jgi:hypothetical protein